MQRIALTLVLAMIGVSPAASAITEIDLSQYVLHQIIRLDEGTLESDPIDEASAVTYNQDTGTLFVLGDEADAIFEITTSGQFVSKMTIVDVDADSEGLTYAGGSTSGSADGGTFYLADERQQDIYAVTYTAGGSVTLASADVVSLGSDVDNQGLEGLSYEFSTGKTYIVKEKNPQAVYADVLDFSLPDQTPTSVFDPSGLGVDDLSGIQVLSNLSMLSGQPDADNLLIYSQESRRLLELDTAGNIHSTFDFSLISLSAEGVTIGDDGTIYVVAESPILHVLKPIPEPTSMALLGVGALALLRRRR